MDAKYDETKEVITLHGLGFLQVKLQGGQRLHVWHPDLPRRKCFEHSSIHDHRFGFVSRVLIGTQLSDIYRVAMVENLQTSREPTHIGYLHEGPRTEFGNRPWIPDIKLRVEKYSRDHVPAGNEYRMEPYVYHSTTPGGDGRVATIMRKTVEYGKGAHSLCAVGVTPEIDFDRKQWSEDRLWNIVLDVLGADNLRTIDKDM